MSNHKVKAAFDFNKKLIAVWVTEDGTPFESKNMAAAHQNGKQPKLVNRYQFFAELNAESDEDPNKPDDDEDPE